MQIIDLFHHITVSRLSLSECYNELKNSQFENKEKLIDKLYIDSKNYIFCDSIFLDLIYMLMLCNNYLSNTPF